MNFLSHISNKICISSNNLSINASVYDLLMILVDNCFKEDCTCTILQMHVENLFKMLVIIANKIHQLLQLLHIFLIYFNHEAITFLTMISEIFSEYFEAKLVISYIDF